MSLKVLGDFNKLEGELTPCIESDSSNISENKHEEIIIANILNSRFEFVHFECDSPFILLQVWKLTLLLI